MQHSAAEAESSNCQGSHYLLHIKEHLASDWSEAFEGLLVTYTPSGETKLFGFLPDQSALHGLLARIRDLNLTLISVNRVVTDNSLNGGIGIVQSKNNLEE